MAHEVTVEELVERLRSRGLRATTARRAVLTEIVAAGTDHLTAEALAQRLQRDHPGIHLSTVYRTLDALTAAGILAVARFHDEPVTFHLADDHHHHAVCTSCGAALELPPDLLDPVRRRLARDHGFVADPHHLTITGRCASCASTGAR